MASHGRRNHQGPIVPVTTPSFLVIVLAQALEDGKLEIPRTVVRQYGNHLEEKIVLKVSKDAIWVLELTKTNGKVWLQKGWPEFARHYSLEHGSLLLFDSQRDSSRFRVHIFMRNTLEMKYPPNSSSIAELNRASNSSHDDSADAIADDDPDSDDAIENDDDDEEEEEEDHENDEGSVDESEDKEETENEQEEDDHSSATLNYAPSCSRTVSSRPHIRRRSMISSIAKAQSNIGSSGGLSRDERRLSAVALEKASASKPSTRPSFVISMSSSYAGGSYLNLPRSFVETHMSEQPTGVTLWVKKSFWVMRSFQVKVNYTDKTTRLQAGWSKVARENNLKVGDTCVFVLTNDREFEVEIFRMTEAVCTSSQGKGKQLR